jgi:hypothetical protein
VPGAGTHALLTRAPLGPGPKPRTPFDLHVLSAPPAFVLSQDQTLSFILVTASSDPAWHPQSLPDHDPKFGPPSPRAITSRDAAPDLAVQANAPSKADKPPDPDDHARARGPPLPKNAHGPTTTSPPPTHPFLFTTLSKDQPLDPRELPLSPTKFYPLGLGAFARRFRRVTPSGSRASALCRLTHARDQALFCQSGGGSHRSPGSGLPPPDRGKSAG